MTKMKFKLTVRDHGTDINVSESNIQTAVLFLNVHHKTMILLRPIFL